ncbi:MAG: hypothetical protein ACFFER_08895 [Candidatus Thorarchaeota archaeon]
MFIGHFGVAFALKKYVPKTSLALLFIGVQLVDIIFDTLFTLGFEHAQIVPGFTEASPFDLYDYPISHSLLGSILWSIVTFLAVRYIPLWHAEDTSYRQRLALVMSLAVLSHFFLDFLVHTPDLLLIPGLDIKVGLGLWNSIIVSTAVELAILIVGCLIYIRTAPKGTEPVGKYGMPIFMIALGIITVITPFNTYPDFQSGVIEGSVILTVLILVAWWLDKKRYTTF